MLQDYGSEMDKTKMLYKTAKQIRSGIANFNAEKDVTDTVTVSSIREDVPPELYSLVRWILVGPEEELQTELRSRTVDMSSSQASGL